MTRFIAALFVAMLLAAASTPANAAPRVSIGQGRISGTKESGVEVFRGIPYAAPPVSTLRWRPPMAAAGWAGLRDGTQFRPDCMQARSPDEPDNMTSSEDCLYLNIWRPLHSSWRNLPVVVWIHGGGFVQGSNALPQYWGDQFAKSGVIFVNFNYRLGRLGFFAFPALTAEHPDELKGNYGYMDQIAALQWVRDNIASFGGDPDQITLAGESAGGEATLVLAGSPMAQGLFQRIIVQSGGGRSPLLGRILLRDDLPGRPSAEAIGIAFAQKMGIAGTDAEALARLRALPAESVNSNLTMVSLVFGALGGFSGPIEDGRLVTASPAKALAATSGHFPILIGTDDADLGFDVSQTKDDAFGKFGTFGADARAIYDPTGKAKLSDVKTQIGMDRMMIEPARLISSQMSQAGNSVFEYRFAYVADSLHGKPIAGAEHSSEIQYAFNTLPALLGEKMTRRDAGVSNVMHGFWVNFIKTGDPNGSGLPAWPAYAPQKDELMMFQADGESHAAPDPWKARLDITASAAEQK